MIHKLWIHNHNAFNNMILVDDIVMINVYRMIRKVKPIGQPTPQGLIILTAGEPIYLANCMDKAVMEVNDYLSTMTTGTGGW